MNHTQQVSDVSNQKPGHTPGPWMFRDSPDPTHRMIFDSSGASGIAKVITKIHEYGKDYPVEARANGHLLAASPELFDACRAAADELAEWDAKIRDLWPMPPGQQPRTAKVLEQLRAAVAKAEGK